MSIIDLAASINQSWKRYRTGRRALRQLESLDDRQLDDIGLSRSGIGDFVRKPRT